MKVELIPVIEISNYGECETPENVTLENSDEKWGEYHRLCNIKAGFSENLIPYTKGQPLYRFNDIPDDDLLKLILKRFGPEQFDDDTELDDLTLAFDGGYILRVDDEDLYFPQCCSDIGDITSWEGLLHGNTKYFYAGHPSPTVTVTSDNIKFDFINSIPLENFYPPVPLDSIEIGRTALIQAIAIAKKELEILAFRLNQINERENLHIDIIDKRLIYGKTE